MGRLRTNEDYIAIEPEESKIKKGHGLIPAGEVEIKNPGQSIGDPPRQKFLVRTSYSDPIVSAYRWKVTQLTLLESLRRQNYKNFEIELICGPDDSLRDEKLKRFNEVAPTRIAPPDWYNLPHTGEWTRTTRVDDDDMLSIEFTEMIAAVPFDGTECMLSFPTGSLWSEGVSHLWEYPENQFLTLQTNTSLTPYHFDHQYFRHMMPTIVVSPEIHWLWIRHHGVLSGATPGAIPKRFTHGLIKIVKQRFPYDFDTIKASLGKDAESHEKVLELRAKFGRTDKHVLDICSNSNINELSALAAKYGTDKGIVGPSQNHQYTLIYNRMFAHHRADVEHVLEFGIGTGASLRMWSDYFPNAQIHGLDIELTKVNHPRVVTHRFNSVTPLDTWFKFDLVIDDASHLSSHQRVMFSLHNRHVKPGGFYVIEDLHAARLNGPRWVDEQPTMLQTCREWVSQPPFGWTCQLYGDQLCVLQKAME